MIAFPALALLLLCGPLPAQDAPLAPADLRCEYKVDPLAIDATKPRFSWEVSDPRRGAEQSAYEIVVAEGAKSVWTSGKTASRETCQIEYGGAPLESFHRYAWKVRTYDAEGRESPWSADASFGTGALDPAAWKAQWIGDATPAPPMHPARNGYHSPFTKTADGSPWIQIDFGDKTTFDEIRLYPAHPYDAPKTKDSGTDHAFLFPIQLKVWGSDEPTFEKTPLKLFDETFRDIADPGKEPFVLHSTTTHWTMRFLRVGATKLAELEGRGFAFALAEVEVYKDGTLVSNQATFSARDSIENGAWSVVNLNDGETESHGPRGYEPLPAPFLRKEFALDAPAARATLYASALGLYDVRINGKRVGESELAPGWTDYDVRVPYLAYDVTGLLRSGKNAIAVQLADGWYAGRLGLSWEAPGGPARAIYGRKPAFFGQLEIEPPAGAARRTIATDATWRSTTAGPVREADLLDGELYDARAELRGADEPGFDDSKWSAVLVAKDLHPRLEALAGEPVKIVQTKKPVAIQEKKPGVHVFDLGQNMVGWCRLRVRAPAGTEIRLRHGEMLDADGALYTANLRGAAQTDRYVAAGVEGETFEPRFTYHGFRYVEVTGLPSKPELEDLVGCAVGNGARYAGTFHASEPLLDKIWSNIHWTLRGNLLSLPTDCPQRDERLGWMGDIAAIAQTAVSQRELAGFFAKWTADVRDAQASDGRFPDFAPHPYGKDARFTGTPAWGDAGVIVPWTAYENYGDRRIVEQNLDAMLRWLEWIRSKNPDLVWRNARGNDYGDWLNGDTLVHEGWPKSGASTPGEVLGTAYFANSAALVAKMAAAVGRTDDAKRCGELAEGIRAAFRKAFVSADGKVQGDSQGAYALALHFDLLDDAMRKLTLERLAKNVEETYGGHLSTGFASTLPALVALSNGGRHDLAAKLVLDHRFPSWGYTIDNGATTLWERWDGFVKDRGFQDAGMNSFNHYAFGAVGEWMVRMLAGIDLDPESPGWSRFRIHPRPCAGVNSLRAERATIHGHIVSSWTTNDQGFELEVGIPPNTSATVVIPAKDGAKIEEGGRPVAEAAPNVRVVSVKDGEATLEVRAGKYKFRSKT